MRGKVLLGTELRLLPQNGTERNGTVGLPGVLDFGLLQSAVRSTGWISHQSSLEHVTQSTSREKLLWKP